MTHLQQIEAIRSAAIKANIASFQCIEKSRHYAKSCPIRRPIRLADILLTIKSSIDVSGVHPVNQSDAYYERLNELGNKLIAGWNLREDNLESQSDDCISFLYELLK